MLRDAGRHVMATLASRTRPDPDHPRVRTALPGPRSSTLLERQARTESGARTYPRNLPIAIARARGPYVEDLDGNVFLDFLNGAGSLPLGHSHPELLEAVHEQLPLLTHGLDFPTEIRDQFVEAHLGMLPASMRGRTRIAFCGPTGANAVEAALKLAKTATGRSEIIAFHGGYHGGSHGAMAVSGGVAQKAPVAGQMPGVHFFPYPDPLHCALGGDPDTLGMRCAEYLDRALRDPIGGVTLPAAVILEVVQGEGGVVPASTDFLQGVRRTTRELGIPLIVDEIQCGCGRTGSWFAFEPHGIDPDVVILSKALGGVGMPVAVILYDESLDAWAPGAHTGTFRGNQAAFAAGVAFLRVLHRDHVLDNVRARGGEALVSLQEIAAEHPEIRAARGAGLMLGLEFASPRDAAATQRAALERGLILELGGRNDAVLRLLPALDITARALGQGLAILRAAVRAVVAGAPLSAPSVPSPALGGVPAAG